MPSLTIGAATVQTLVSAELDSYALIEHRSSYCSNSSILVIRQLYRLQEGKKARAVLQQRAREMMCRRPSYCLGLQFPSGSLLHEAVDELPNE